MRVTGISNVIHPHSSSARWCERQVYYDDGTLVARYYDEEIWTWALKYGLPGIPGIWLRRSNADGQGWHRIGEGKLVQVEDAVAAWRVMEGHDAGWSEEELEQPRMQEMLRKREETVRRIQKAALTDPDMPFRGPVDLDEHEEVR